MNCVLHLKPHLRISMSGHRLGRSPTPPPPPSKLQSNASPLNHAPTAATARSEAPTTPVEKEKAEAIPAAELPRWVLLGGASLGLALLLMGIDPQRQASALGPEGPLMEEFWDNVRRYVLYALTVSTGAIYTITQPIIELLKNPITAVLIIVVLAGTFYLLSQVLSAMVGISEFSYDYAY
ncbi:hypothetical protein B296_00045610 [Ensete ventricosum]|uniref:Uncharacterized protein ycf33 n=1 Tax=Ensete ventricosum TaxID=4639 RepID=A0A426XVA3_ENSVE|nr:hypothetical protein B296_00045610 [Ensete ventricosum]